MIDLNATFFAQILNFLILVAILRLVAYKPIMGMLDARAQRISASIAKADEDKAEAAKALKKQQADLIAAQTKAAEIVDMAEKRARDERDAQVAATKREIEQMKKNAAEEIERDRDRAAEGLRSEVVALSLAAAGKIIGENLDAAKNEKLISDFIDQLNKEKVGELPC